MKKQQGVSLSGLMFWGVVVAMAAILLIKVTPPSIEYYKISKDAKATVAQVAPGSTVADVRAAYAKYAEIDHIAPTVELLDISKDGGQVVISFSYEKRIPLFWNVSLLINYQGSTAN
jgi:hypothetical protein